MYKLKSIIMTGVLVATIAVPAAAFSKSSNGYTKWNDGAGNGVAITRSTGVTGGGTKQTYGIAGVGNGNTNYKWTQVTINGQTLANDNNSKWVQTETLSVGGDYYTVYEDHTAY